MSFRGSLASLRDVGLGLVDLGAEARARLKGERARSVLKAFFAEAARMPAARHDIAASRTKARGDDARTAAAG